MSYRAKNLIACLTGGVIGSLTGLYLMLTVNSPPLAMLSMALLPTFACWMSGVRNYQRLFKIAIYSGIGWMLTFMLQPTVGQTAASRARRIADLPLVGNEWHIPACAVATLLALVAVFFMPRPSLAKSGFDNSANADALVAKTVG